MKTLYLLVKLVRGSTIGRAVLIATHDPTVYERCDMVVRLRDGLVVDCSSGAAV